MIQYAVVFFVIALVSAMLGFSGLTADSAAVARMLFCLFLIGGVVASLVGGLRHN